MRTPKDYSSWRSQPTGDKNWKVRTHQERELTLDVIDEIHPDGQCRIGGHLGTRQSGPLEHRTLLLRIQMLTPRQTPSRVPDPRLHRWTQLFPEGRCWRH